MSVLFSECLPVVVVDSIGGRFLSFPSCPKNSLILSVGRLGESTRGHILPQPRGAERHDELVPRPQTLLCKPRQSTRDGSGSTPNTNPPPDQVIIEALRGKDRLFVLKLGEQMEALINERKSVVLFPISCPFRVVPAMGYWSPIHISLTVFRVAPLLRIY